MARTEFSLSTDTINSIATNLAAAITATTSLQNIGVSASASSNIVSIESLSPNLTTYTESTSTSATETIALAPTIGATQSAYNSVNELISTASGGAVSFQGTTDKPVKSATLSSQVVSISATPPVASSFAGSATATPTETVTVAQVLGSSPYGASGSQYNVTIGGSATAGDALSLTVYDVRISAGSETVSYTVKSGDSTTSIASALYGIVSADPVLHPLDIWSQSTGSNNFYIYANDNISQPVNNMAITNSVVGIASETVSLTNTADLNVNATIGGTAHAGDIISVTTTNADLSNGQEVTSYTVASGNTLTNIATGLAAAINADTHLQAIGVAATSSAAVVSIVTDTSYTVSKSAGATETITLGADSRGNSTVIIGGKPTTSDTVTVTAHNNSLSSDQEAVTYTVLSTDTTLSIAAGLAAAMNADTHLQTLGITASNSSGATLATTQNFTGKTLLPTGASTAGDSAVDGGSNTKSNGYQLSVPTGTSTSLSYDLNGNLLNDGTNAYSWDCENRLLQITYPGSGNNSQFSYDGFGRNVQILEYSAGSLSSTKAFVWAADAFRPFQPCEARNSTGTITAQYFPLGETISGTSYYYTTDHLGLTDAMVTAATFSQLSLLTDHPGGFNPIAHSGSTRELTNSSGTVEAQLAYDPSGRSTQLQGSMSPDFQYAGYYNHAPSGLQLTLHRAYDSSLARWLSRDPLGEAVSLSAVAPNALTHPKMLLQGHVAAESSDLALGIETPVPETPPIGARELLMSATTTYVSGLGAQHGPNLYGYVDNNPTNITDPDGRCGFWCWVAIAAGVIIGTIVICRFVEWYKQGGGNPTGAAEKGFPKGTH